MISEKENKREYILWGLATMFIFAPLGSCVIGIIFGVIYHDGFTAGGIMVILFPIIFLIGLYLIVQGIFKKKTA
ncbi:hypothetical protein [Bacillus massiliigorillae]|uniref:hypothetical protein n=1 Tax=Bacillus massiliigorillae TaxID=1243664 RepID=UPI00039AEDB4|nr:hypothetical protein [Bacillus massiliigorillae]